MKLKISAFAVCVIWLGTSSLSQAGDISLWGKSSDVLASGLGLAAVSLAALEKDKDGLKQGTKVAVATLLTVEALKRSIPKARPDFSDNRSFPSGHTALAFAAAGYIDRRYGHEKPIAAVAGYSIALLTGISRVKAKKHFPLDVLAGAVIGWTMANRFTTTNNPQLNFDIDQQEGLRISYEKKF